MKQEGYNMFYECNNCQNIMYKYIDLSFIIRSAVPLYSDRRSFSTSLSLITRCKKCNIVFWLGENIQSISEENDKSKCPIESSTIYEYLEAINTNLFNTKSEEIYLRKMLWWSFNDRARE